MRKCFVVLATTASLVCGAAGLAGAAPMYYSGTSWSKLGDYPAGIAYGMGVATINGSAGVTVLGGHISTVRQALSRGNVGGTFTVIVTDPVVFGNYGPAALIYSNYWPNTGTFAPISGGAASTGAVLTQNVLKVTGLVR